MVVVVVVVGSVVVVDGAVVVVVGAVVVVGRRGPESSGPAAPSGWRSTGVTGGGTGVGSGGKTVCFSPKTRSSSVLGGDRVLRAEARRVVAHQPGRRDGPDLACGPRAGRALLPCTKTQRRAGRDQREENGGNEETATHSIL